MANNKAEDLCSFQKNICPQTGRLIKTPCGIISPNKESLADHVPHCSPLVVSQIRKIALDSPALHCTTSFFNSCLAGQIFRASRRGTDADSGTFNDVHQIFIREILGFQVPGYVRFHLARWVRS